MAVDFRWDDPFGKDIEFGFVDRKVDARGELSPRILTNADDGTMLRALREELRTAESFAFSVAFVSPGALNLLKQELIDFRGTGTIVTSDYLGFNSPAAFRELLALRRFGIDVRIHEAQAFHPKGYVFAHAAHVTAILGSSNLTKAALVSNHEWNIRVSARPDSDLQSQLLALVEAQVANSSALTDEWVDAYELNYVQPKTPLRTRTVIGNREVMPDPARPFSEIVPNSMQLEALTAIDACRRAGQDRALVISATGTGKTILSALDVRAVDPDRMLFVVHREQILDRAMREFACVLGMDPDEIGKLAGSSKDAHKRYVFATVQSLSRPETLASFDPHDFEYILIDEAHRAGSPSYQRVLSHFRPTFLLGMTATPERTDGYDLFQLFDYNVAYEIRLSKALEADMLAPFHYFGVADYTTDDGVTTDELSDLSKLVATARVDYLVSEIEKYGHAGVPVRGLMFCRNKDEARRLSAELNLRSINGKRLRTIALTGDDTIEARDVGVRELENDQLDYILTVDIFNEGIDIPSVNQIVMLRQTQSAIVFVQQLGRGLRKAEHKDSLIVIDFIGNYANNFMIPIALFGDSSLNKESLRKNLIGAEEVGVVAGLSSVRFDKVAQERVLASIASAKLDGRVAVRRAFDELRHRIGRVPTLVDYLDFESADPVVMATTVGLPSKPSLVNYPGLVDVFLKKEAQLTTQERRTLSFLSVEVLDSKRPQDAQAILVLLENGHLDTPSLHRLLQTRFPQTTSRDVDSVLRNLSLRFAVRPDRDKYGSPVVEWVEETGQVSLSASFIASRLSNPAFGAAVEDVLSATIRRCAQLYPSGTALSIGAQYTRKDAARLLGWRRDEKGTINGYKVDKRTRTCPIFFTLHKGDEVAENIAYEDAFLSADRILWFSRTPRKITSGELRPILQNEVDLHVFVMKEGADGGAHYYLGQARAENAAQQQMRGDGPNVVQVELALETRVPAALFDYFNPLLTDWS